MMTDGNANCILPGSLAFRVHFFFFFFLFHLCRAAAAGSSFVMKV